MNPQTLHTISEISVALVLAGIIICLYFALIQKVRPPEGIYRAVIALLGAVAVITWAGSRFLRLWPMTCFHVALAIYMTYQTYAYYRCRPATGKTE
jgi:uncharacterized membrane protein